MPPRPLRFHPWLVALVCAGLLVPPRHVGATPRGEDPPTQRWRLSASDTDPFVNSVPFTGAMVHYVYLWLESANFSDGPGPGIGPVYLRLVQTGASNLNFGFTPTDWLNAGDERDLILYSTGDCTTSNRLVGWWVLFIQEPSTLCLGNGRNAPLGGESCSDTWFDIEYVGLDVGGGPCETIDVGSGGCCLPDETCEWLHPTECAERGGEYLGDWGACGECEWSGACCKRNGECVETSQAGCDSIGGIYQGHDTSCDDVDCSLGTCCYPDGSCVEGASRQQCWTSGGIFRAGKECADVECPPISLDAFQWTISTSDEDPHANSAPIPHGMVKSYLWLLSCPGPGMSAASFLLTSSSSYNAVLAFEPRNGFVNHGSKTAHGLDLILEHDACPTGPVVAGEITADVWLEGNLCVAPSLGGLIRETTVDCEDPPAAHVVDAVGLTYGSGGPMCDVVAVERTTWGQVKARYR